MVKESMEISSTFIAKRRYEFKTLSRDSSIQGDI